MSIKRHSFLILFLFNFFYVSSKADWTVLIYMDHNENLIDMAIKNLSEMISVTPSNRHVNIFIQLHAYENFAIRYKVENNMIKPMDHIKLKKINKENLKDAIKWAFETNKAEKNGVIFWGHGFGILEPNWDPEKNEWSVEPDITQEICQYKPFKIIRKGFLLSNYPKGYLKNNDIIENLKYLYDIIGKKIDFIGFDTCMGISLELNYQFASFVNFHVGSQNCEVKEGWNYKKIISSLYQNKEPKEIVKVIVDSFDEMYCQKISYADYTISAIDLSYIVQIIKKLEIFIQEVITKPNLKPVIKEIRQKCCTCCAIPMYVDIIIFFEKLLEKLENNSNLFEIIKLIKKSIISNKIGHHIKENATGNSIYLPLSHMDSSYAKSLFAQETSWLKFLNYLIT